MAQKLGALEPQIVAGNDNRSPMRIGERLSETVSWWLE